jgi:hypothetical protein
MDVAGVAGDDVWAVGFCGQTPLTLHWDGAQWSFVPVPVGSGWRNALYGVAVVAADDVWAVGSYNGSNGQQPLILRWDGTQWNLAPLPPNLQGQLNRVTVVSPTDVWAVGHVLDGQGNPVTTIILHWDGQAWSVVPSPNVPGVGNGLYSVAAVTATDIWAVGVANQQPLSLHWDGTAWSIVPNVTVGGPFFGLFGVAARASNDVWAVGGSLIEHWDGSTWSVVPGLPPDGRVWDVTTDWANEVWAVGHEISPGGDTTLIMRYTGLCLSPTPTASPTATVPPTVTPTPGPPSPTPTATQGCGPQWQVVASPNVTPQDNRLYSLAAVAPDDLWAVGEVHYRSEQTTGGPYADALALHYTAGGWTIVPNPATYACVAWGVAGVAPNDVWVVGYCVDQIPFSLHWDGAQWTIVPVPATGGTDALYGVAALASDDVWAVGCCGDEGGPLILHWDGGQWHQIPGLSNHPGVLIRVAALSPTDVWAVGTGYSATNETLTLHWDGQDWSVVPSPNVPGVGNDLYNLTALAANDIWAVGATYTLNPFDRDPLSLHWDGTAWSIIPNITIGDSPYGLYGVTARASNDVWAVGGNLIEHWDGSAWAAVPNPRPNSVLFGAAIGPGNEVWVAGLDSGETLTMRYTDPCLSPTPTRSPTATVPPTVTPILTHTPSPTPTQAASTPTLTPCPVCASATPPASQTPTVPPTACTLTFNDVPPGSTFYDYVRCLACAGIVGGYPCGGPGEPCPGAYYRPNNNVTRGQTSKIVAAAAGFADPIPSTQQTFADVPPSGTFWLWIEQLAARGIIGGYPCGGPFEPCIPPDNRPYFRPNNNVTRGQLSKITGGAAGWTETPTGQTFADVPPGQTFYLTIERMAVRGIIQGYPCGGVGEPCIAPSNRPYFRPNTNATRGQMSKIAAITFYPGCAPLRR